MVVPQERLINRVRLNVLVTSVYHSYLSHLALCCPYADSSPELLFRVDIDPLLTRTLASTAWLTLTLPVRPARPGAGGDSGVRVGRSGAGGRSGGGGPALRPVLRRRAERAEQARGADQPGEDGFLTAEGCWGSPEARPGGSCPNHHGVMLRLASLSD